MRWVLILVAVFTFLMWAGYRISMALQEWEDRNMRKDDQ